MNKKNLIRERGQSLVIVAIMLVALIGMLALIIDGGISYANRRSAQNAADAAALAGAQKLCSGATVSDVTTEVQNYVINNNATYESGDIVVDTVHNYVTVTSRIPYDTFLAGILNRPQMLARAQASAGCFVPCGATSVLPVAWACKPAAWYGEGQLATPTPDPQACTTKMGTMSTPGPLYLIMDSLPSTGGGGNPHQPTPTPPGQQLQDFYCQNPPNSGTPAGTLDCDTNNDGFDDVLPSSQRSWLALDGGNGSAAQLRSWLENGYPGLLRIHDWLPQSSGVETSIFHAATVRIDQIVVVPVFDEICQGDNPEVDCPYAWHTGVDINRRQNGTGQNYHIIQFSPFKITCVDPSTEHPQPTCPARQNFIQQNNIQNTGNFKTIEGYFVSDYVPDLKGACGTGANQFGSYTVYLRH